LSFGSSHYTLAVRRFAHTFISALVSLPALVNQALLFRNWLIGAYVVEYEQCGEDRAAYGAGLLADLARDLRPSTSAAFGARGRCGYAAAPEVE